MLRVLILLMILTSCATVAPSPTPRSTIAPTVSYDPSPTAPPTATDTAEPIPTPAPTSTFTLEPTETPTLTATYTSTATPMASLTVRVLTVMTITGRTPTAVAEAVEWGVIPNLVFHFKPPTDGTTITTLANYNTTFIMTYKDEPYRDNLRAMGETVDLQYVRGDGFQDPLDVWNDLDASCGAIPFGNGVAFEAGNSCWIRDNHPDWALRDVSGNIIRQGGANDGVILADFGNVEWQQWFIQRILQMQTQFGWRAIFLDNIPMSRQHAGRPLRDYPTDASYQAAVMSFLRALQDAVGDRPVYANVISQTTDVMFLQYASYLDGVFDEAWGVGWSGSYWSASKWLSQIVRTEAILAQGIEVMGIAQGTPTDTARFRFAYATYLLTARPGLSFRYSNAQNGGYRQWWHYPEYDYDLGTPLGIRYTVDGITWRRDFTNAVVTVNPTTRAGTITVINP